MNADFRGAEGEVWEARRGNWPGPTSGKKKQSSEEPPGRAGQDGSWLPGKDRASPLSREARPGKAHGQEKKSRGQWKLSLRGRKGQQGRSSISGD